MRWFFSCLEKNCLLRPPFFFPLTAGRTPGVLLRLWSPRITMTAIRNEQGTVHVGQVFGEQAKATDTHNVHNKHHTC